MDKKIRIEFAGNGCILAHEPDFGYKTVYEKMMVGMNPEAHRAIGRLIYDAAEKEMDESKTKVFDIEVTITPVKG